MEHFVKWISAPERKITKSDVKIVQRKRDESAAAAAG